MVNCSIFGLHSSFYYFGLEHLIINMYQYIKNGIERKEKICVYGESKWYKELLKYADIKNKYIQYADITQIINEYPKLKINNVREELLKYINQISREGCTGLRFIVQVDYAIYNTSEVNFLNFSKDILTIISGTSSSCMYVYDFEDYLNNKKVINENVIRKSYKIHNYRLYNRKMEKLVNLKL